jgi:hypothetical protein
VQHAGTALGQARFEQRTRDRVCKGVPHAVEHPPVIEQDEHDADARITRAFEAGVEVCEDVRIEAGGLAAIVVDDPERPSANTNQRAAVKPSDAMIAKSAATADRRVDTPRCEPQMLAPKSRP